jgi:hypothetical protein
MLVGMEWVRHAVLDSSIASDYILLGIRITVEGKDVPGRTFMWASDPTELVEGTWSLEAWKSGVEDEMASHFRPLKD